MRSRLLAVPLLAAALTPALSFPPPKPTPPEKATLKTIETRSEQLAAAVDRLRRKGVGDPALSDIEVFLQAARRTVRHGEWYHKNSADWCLAALDEGLLRASQQARGEAPWWQVAGGPVVRGYRSRVDGSVQPYAVTLPHDYARPGKRYRIDVVLHGRDDALTEVRFLHEHDGEKPAAKDQTWVQIDVYGRGNNGYRWAGETDVWEALNHFLGVEQGLGRGEFPDATRVVLRGFSMGGAGTWHIGLHKPDSFCVLGPGAGFTTTHGYVKGLPEKLPDYQEACLRIYDAADYAENAFNVPVVAYAGEKDPQVRAARNVQARLKGLDLPTPMTLLVAPGLKHEFPPAWQKKAQALYAKYADREREEYPARVRFVTYTLKYAACSWVEVLGLERHYRRALVEAEANQAEARFTVKTANVRVLHLNLWQGGTRNPVDVDIDGQKLEGVRPYRARSGNLLHLYLEKRGGKWSSVLPERLLTARLRRPEKTRNLQGPIDDAFTGPFLCVRGTGKPWHESTGRYAEAELARFRAEWSKYLRGELPVKDDVEVTAEDLATRHLVLFGDPSSNSLIEQALEGLPLRWTKKQITWDGKDYDASTHVPVLIYPSPLASGGYVVLNSGHTFHAPDFARTNALLYPRLGDYAVLKLKGDKKDPLAAEVQTAGLFDEFWGLPKRP
jgi:dienelactone hydrolase